MTNEKTTTMLASPSLSRRSMSPSPRRLTDIRKKQSSLEAQPTNTQDEPPLVNEAKVESSTNGTNDGANKYENISDNGSEISDEGYRSLGLIQSNNAKRISLHSQVSNEDAETNGEK
jgi:growth arrest-specific protein 2